MMEREKLISLVRAVQDGKDGAAGELYDAFYDDIYYHILKTVDKDPELAADLTQDTFMEILETIGKLQEPAAFVTWSRQIAYHKCTGYFRKRRDILLDEQEDGYSAFDTLEEDRAEFIPDEALDKEDFKQTIHAMISELPEEQRSALLLRYFNEVSVKEIAQIQGVTEGTVKSRLNYARKAIKTAVESYEKKYDIRLHCAGVVPMLLWFFRAYRRAQGMAVTVGSATAVFAVGETAAAATGAAATGTAAGAAAAKTGIFGSIKAFVQTLAGKVIAGITAATIVVGGTAALVTQLDKKEEPVYLEKWSGYIEEWVREQGREEWVPIEGSQMHVELEILEAAEDHYDTVVRIDWERGEYVSDCRLEYTHSYDNVHVYTGDIIPAYFNLSPKLSRHYDVITYVHIQYIEDQDYIFFQFVGQECTGELYPEDPENNVFRDSPIEKKKRDDIFGEADREDLRIFWEHPEGDRVWMTLEEFAEMDEEHAVMQDGSYGAYERLMLYKIEGSDQIAASIEPQTVYKEHQRHVVIPREIDGVPVTQLVSLRGYSLESIEIPDTVTIIPEEAFVGCEALQEVILPGSIREIGEGAFQYCGSLRSLEIPEGVEIMGDWMFYWCEGLETISLPSTLKELGQNPFYYCPALETITVAPGNETYHSSGNCLIETESGTLLVGCKASRIPEDGSVSTIGSFAFAANTALTSLTVPEGVERIGYCAFAKCTGLKELSLPKSLEWIDDQAFIFCGRLSDIYYAGTMEDFENIRGIRWDAGYQELNITVHCADGDIVIGG